MTGKRAVTRRPLRVRWEPDEADEPGSENLIYAGKMCGWVFGDDDGPHYWRAFPPGKDPWGGAQGMSLVSRAAAKSSAVRALWRLVQGLDR
jgi:hypothetical protein